jgi:hypothetical protein
MMMRRLGTPYQYIPPTPEPEMLSPAKRLIVITSAISLVAACASPTAPTPAQSRIAQPTAPRFDIDSSMCRSGYNVGQSRCNGET